MFRVNGLNSEEVAPMRGEGLETVDCVVVATHINAIFVEISGVAVGGKTYYARMTPGKMYLNGRRNLQCLFRSSEHLRMFFPHGARFKVSVVEAEVKDEFILIDDEKKHPNVMYRERRYKGRLLEWDKRMLRVGERKQSLEVSHVVWKMWSEPVESSLGKNVFAATGTALGYLDKEVDSVLDAFQKTVLSKEDGAAATPPSEEESSSKARWFCSHLYGLEPRGPVTFTALMTVQEGLKGTVVRIERPHGGIIEINGERIYFHRERVLVNGLRIGHADILEDDIREGDQVVCDVVDNIVWNMNGSTTLLIEHSGTARLAKWVFKGSKGTIPKPICLKEMTCEYPEAHRIKIVELIADKEDGIVKSGIGMILMSPSVLKQFKGLDGGVVGKYVWFTRETLHYVGYSIARMDLNHIMKPHDEMFAKVKIVHGPVGRYMVSFEVVVGALTRMVEEVLVKDGRLPELVHASSQSQLNCLRKGGYERLEKVLNGKMRSQVPTGMAHAVLMSHEQSDKDGIIPTNTGHLLIMSGPNKGQTVGFVGAQCSVFGRLLDKADLTDILQPYEGVIVQQPVGPSDTLKVIVGPPYLSSPDPNMMAADERLDFITWLHAHSMLYSDFVTAVEGKKVVIHCVPFFIGEVIHGKVEVMHPRSNSDSGSTQMLLTADNGYAVVTDTSLTGVDCGLLNMEGKKVAVDRSVLWVFGRCARNVTDLAGVLPWRTKVRCEVREMSAEYKDKKYPFLPDVNYEAIIAWVGASRPKYVEYPDHFDSGIQEWLHKREMSKDVLVNLLNGGEADSISAVEWASNQPSNQGNQAKKANKGQSKTVYLKSLLDPIAPPPPVEPTPVLNHGLDVAEVVEGAIQASGPDDPVLNRLIQNQDIAMKAYHIASALKVAVDKYKAKRGGATGFSRGVPPPPHGTAADPVLSNLLRMASGGQATRLRAPGPRIPGVVGARPPPPVLRPLVPRPPGPRPLTAALVPGYRPPVGPGPFSPGPYSLSAYGGYGSYGSYGSYGMPGGPTQKKKKM